MIARRSEGVSLGALAEVIFERAMDRWGSWGGAQ